MNVSLDPFKERQIFSALYWKQGLTPGVITHFRGILYSYYSENGRNLPWRGTNDPYQIFVSEIMLQQTQVERVTTKFVSFIETFPNFESLAYAPLEKILKNWQGLGYNRRAIHLQKSAGIVINKYKGQLPSKPEELIKLPGIGKATAASIAAFAYNYPSVFIETNIRSVFIFFFFCSNQSVEDDKLMPIIKKTMDNSSPQRWYSALMDYGTMLKRFDPGLTQKSAHYKKQKPFKGSNRQIRGQVLRLLLQERTVTFSDLRQRLQGSDDRLKEILDQLQIEGFIMKQKGRYTIPQEVYDYGEEDSV